MRIAFRGALVILVVVAAATRAQSQTKPEFTNQDIVLMRKAGLSDPTIVKAIDANDTAFDVSAPALITLKNSGLSDTIIEVMLAASAKSADRKPDTPKSQPETVSSLAVPKIGSSLEQFQREKPRAECRLDVYNKVVSFCFVNTVDLEGQFLFPGIPVVREIVFFDAKGLIMKVNVHIGSEGLSAQKALNSLYGKTTDFFWRAA